MQETKNTAHAERMQRLAETGRGTDMGNLLRQFWQPVALARSVEPGKARALRILGEDLTLYRGKSGTPHLVGGKCAHRRTEPEAPRHVDELGVLRRHRPVHRDAGRERNPRFHGQDRRLSAA